MTFHGYPALAESERRPSVMLHVPMPESTVLREAPTLPGHGPRGEGCGEPRALHCHPCGKAFWGRRRCLSRDCPDCYSLWAGVEGRTAGRRAWRAFGLLDAAHRGRLLHVVIAFVDDGCSLSDLRVRARRAMVEHGIVGGLMIWHPWRKDETNHYAPDGTTHFHIVGWAPGDVRPGDGVDYIFKVIVDAKAGDYRGFQRWRDVAATVRYMLTHAAIVRDRHALTWWGRMSYSSVPSDPADSVRYVAVADGDGMGQPCPSCGSRLTTPCFVWDRTEGRRVRVWPPPEEDPPPRS